MLQILELSVESTKLKEVYEHADKEFVRQYWRRLIPILVGGILLYTLAIVGYCLTSYSKDWMLFYNWLSLGSAAVFCYFAYEYYEFRYTLKFWRAEVNSVKEKYAGIDNIHFHYDEDGIKQYAGERLIEAITWKEIGSYTITNNGIWLYDSKHVSRIRIPLALAGEEEYRKLETIVKEKVKDYKIIQYNPSEHPEGYKKTMKGIFSYIFTTPIPWFTLLFFGICVGIWGGLALEKDLTTWEGYNRWGYFGYHTILQGAYYGVGTNSFVHEHILHLYLNMYWLIVFGSKIEKEIGAVYYVILTISSAFICSSIELIFADDTGIGYSGVIYTYFGFILIAARYSENFKYYLSRKDIGLFLAWIFICIAMTYTEILSIANAAHISGLLWGLAVAILYYAGKQRIFATFVIVGMVALSSLPFVWAPWSVNWLSEQAFQEHNKGNYDQARKYYDQVLEKQPDNEWAKNNRALLP